MSDQSIRPTPGYFPMPIAEIRREFGRWLLRLIIGQSCFFAVSLTGSEIVKALVENNHVNYAFALALLMCSFAGFNLAWLCGHRSWHSRPVSEASSKRVLILAYCGHKRWIEADAPMDSEARAIEKCRPCPECRTGLETSAED